MALSVGIQTKTTQLLYMLWKHIEFIRFMLHLVILFLSKKIVMEMFMQVVAMVALSFMLSLSMEGL